MEITLTLSKNDIEILEAYRVLSDYEYDLDLEKFVNTKHSHGGSYELDLKLLLQNILCAYNKVKS